MVNDLQIPDYHVTVDGLKIHYKSLGQGKPIILVHGSSNDWREWYMNIPILAKQFRVIALDLPGFGLSESSGPLSLSWMSSFLNSFMRAVGLEKADVIGHSLGGMIALAFALDFPDRVRKVVLVNSAGLGELSPAGQLLLFTIKGIKKVFGKHKEKKYKKGSPEEWILVKLH